VSTSVVWSDSEISNQGVPLQAETCDNDIIHLKKLGPHRTEIRDILDLSGEQDQLIKQVFDEEGR
jgi:hypothetical protein